MGGRWNGVNYENIPVCVYNVFISETALTNKQLSKLLFKKSGPIVILVEYKMSLWWNQKKYVIGKSLQTW